MLLTARAANGSPPAHQEGAFDYVPKPFDIDELEALSRVRSS